MKIWTALIMIVTLATVVAASATIGALLGMLIAFLLGAANVSSAAPVGALSGGFAILVFLMNAKENGGKGLS